LGEEWLSETEVPEEFEEMGRRFPDGATATSVGGKQGVYVDIEDLREFSPIPMTM
jgi:hypothetical protein